MEKLRIYLEGHLYIVVTAVDVQNHHATRFICLALRLQEFTFTIEYRKDKYNMVPDPLSREPKDVQASLSEGATLMYAQS